MEVAAEPKNVSLEPSPSTQKRGRGGEQQLPKPAAAPSGRLGSRRSAAAPVSPFPTLTCRNPTAHRSRRAPSSGRPGSLQMQRSGHSALNVTRGPPTVALPRLRSAASRQSTPSLVPRTAFPSGPRLRPLTPEPGGAPLPSRQPHHHLPQPPARSARRAEGFGRLGFLRLPRSGHRQPRSPNRRPQPRSQQSTCSVQRSTSNSVRPARSQLRG